MNQVEQAIVKTLCYADIFDYPLTQPEIFQYLIWAESDKPPRKKDFISPLFSLAKAGHIAQTKGHFYLPGRKALVDLRKKKAGINIKKSQLAWKLLQPLEENPNILGVLLTGALAMNNAESTDDIDVMIITAAHKLWTTRPQVTFALRGKRRTPTAKKVNNLICTNMYVDETALAVPTNIRSLYTAHEVAQVKPLINKDHIYERFLIANQWIQQHLPNILVPSNTLTPGARLSTPNLIETLAYHLQYRYMKPKITRETVTRNVAYFHPRNTSKHVLHRYQTNLNRFLNPKNPKS
jgi:hypothetical protein